MMLNDSSPFLSVTRQTGHETALPAMPAEIRRFA